MSRFSAASAVTASGDGEFTAELSPAWTVGGRPHGGYLLAVVARAALAVSGAQAPDPLVVSAQFLRAPSCGPATVRAAVRRSGRTVTVVAATLEQGGDVCVEATVTCGVLPEADAMWQDVPQLPAEPTADAIDVPGDVFTLAKACRLRLDGATAGYAVGRTDLPPLTRLWVQPDDEPPDPLFALVAGDISPPVVLNLGRFGWSPTVQLTALLRARPSPGWLRVQAECRAVLDSWFDEDHTVVDAAGRLVCQARQLALMPASRGGGGSHVG